MIGKTHVFSLVLLLCLGASPEQFAARQATVVIEGEVQTPQGLRAATGAGVIVGQRGGLEILTAYHVAKHDHLKVITWDGEELNAIEVVHLLPRDLAILKTPIPQRVYPMIEIAKAGNAGSPMFTYGAPNNQKWTLSTGAIRDTSLVPAQFTNGEFAMACATCDNGSSGGGIFNTSGELEGILIAGYTAPDGVYTFIAEPVPGDVLANR